MHETTVERDGEGVRSRILDLAGAPAGGRLDVFLATSLSLSRAQVRRLLERGSVSLDGRPLALRDKGMSLPGAGALRIEAFRSQPEQRAAPESEGAAPAIVACGAGWLAIDKPPGMPVHPLREGERGTALGYVIARHPEIHGVGEGGLRSGVVHRLDVETSGVLLFATDESQWHRLRGAFQDHRVEKRYRALVAGRFDPPGGCLEIEMPLVVARHRPALVRLASAEEIARGRARVTLQSVHTVAVLGEATIVEVRPRTGFLHQIRASLAHLGHPVLGDRRYGAEAERVTNRSGAGRHMLHAAAVAFEDIHAETPDPPDFVACVAALGGVDDADSGRSANGRGHANGSE